MAQAAEPAVEQQQKPRKVRRTKSAVPKKRGAGLLPGLAKAGKIVAGVGKEIARLEDEERAATTKRMKNNERLRIINRMVFNGYYEETLSNHRSVTDDDKSFMRTEFGFDV